MTAAVAIGAPERKWSRYQSDVFAAVEASGGHIVVEALAGSGKSSTIEEAVHRTYAPSRVLVAAFNKEIATALQRRIRPAVATVSTLHSYGLRACSAAYDRPDIDGTRVAAALRQPQWLGGEWSSREARTAVAKIVGLAKGCLVGDRDGLDRIIDTYDVSMPMRSAWTRPRILDVAQRFLAAESTRRIDSIDFDDMIWLPAIHDLTPTQYDWIFVDETQDLNPAQLRLVTAGASKGRIVAVGDRRQAIYGFRGADAQAIPRMIERLSATVLPLSICYRCASSIIAEAQTLVPQIEAAPGAHEGIVRQSTVEAMLRDAMPGDFVVSRTNAPLVSAAFRLLAQGRRAMIRGRNIGEGLVALVKSTRASTVIDLLRCIAGWRDAEVARLTALERDTSNVIDKAECVVATASGCATVDEVVAKITGLFADVSPRDAVVLSSTHRAKGLEADRVWLLRDTYMRRPGAEEANLLYVGITRAKNELIYVHDEKERDDDK